jgi:hypothetical protein
LDEFFCGLQSLALQCVQNFMSLRDEDRPHQEFLDAHVQLSMMSVPRNRTSANFAHASLPEKLQNNRQNISNPGSK